MRALGLLMYLVSVAACASTGTKRAIAVYVSPLTDSHADLGAAAEKEMRRAVGRDARFVLEGNAKRAAYRVQASVTLEIAAEGLRVRLTCRMVAIAVSRNGKLVGIAWPGKNFSEMYVDADEVGEVREICASALAQGVMSKSLLPLLAQRP